MHNTPYATRRNGLPVKPRLKLLRSKEFGAYVDPSTREKGAVRTSLTPRERTRASVTISRQGIPTENVSCRVTAITESDLRLRRH